MAAATIAPESSGLTNIFEEVLRNVVDHLSVAPQGSVEITLEINAKSSGFDDRVRRVVSENSKQLGAKSGEFE